MCDCDSDSCWIFLCGCLFDLSLSLSKVTLTEEQAARSGPLFFKISFYKIFLLDRFVSHASPPPPHQAPLSLSLALSSL